MGRRGGGEAAAAGPPGRAPSRRRVGLAGPHRPPRPPVGVSGVDQRGGRARRSAARPLQLWNSHGARWPLWTVIRSVKEPLAGGAGVGVVLCGRASVEFPELLLILPCVGLRLRPVLMP
jgi:hypothetical protein